METICVLLHEHKHYLNKCVEILNEEWPRSVAAREHSLEKSMPNGNPPYPGLPCAMVLVAGTEPDKEAAILGHSRLMPVHGEENSCLIESVVVKKSHRGKGLGKKLMSCSGKQALNLGITTMYLVTMDKQDFYKHIGYSICEPVRLSSFMSCNRESKRPGYDEFLKQYLGSRGGCCAKDNKKAAPKQDSESVTSPDSSTITSASDTCIPSPPAPPLPPPPPPKDKKSSQKTKYGKSIVRIDPDDIFWMKKSLI
ncbi:unnamed protein product [Owenia fusiformis]|uniref:N-acetyltransferase domain-containing protein n=1 Tax=Owenia fusiformis TaxID=6347 RepID=A0A8S4PH75_OWEFU|nr:unnamed protein product [Owenia fusiformis]